MFPSKDELSRPARPWRDALHRAAGLVVAFATLDSYALPGGPHDSSTDRSAHRHHAHREPLRPAPRRRGHGSPPVIAGLCVATSATHRTLRTAPAARTAPRV